MSDKIKANLFSLLYGRLAGLYDFVSLFVSKGKWRKWQYYAVPELKGNVILDVGCGSGNLIRKLLNQGYLAFGLDFSWHMAALCRQNVIKVTNYIPIVQGDFRFLPLKSGQIDTLVATFPTDVILSNEFYEEAFRVLVSQGRLIIIDFPQSDKEVE